MAERKKEILHITGLRLTAALSDCNSFTLYLFTPIPVIYEFHFPLSKMLGYLFMNLFKEPLDIMQYTGTCIITAVI